MPLDEGGVLLLGMYEYFDIAQEESFIVSFPEEIKRSEAYAIALDAQGERLWSIRLGDPQSHINSFHGTQLQDGRYLLKLSAHCGQFEHSYFIVNQMGEVEEMLPNDTLHELGAKGTLSARGDAFYAGGAIYSLGAYSPMGEKDQIMKLDADLSPIWALDNPFGMDAYLWYGDTMCVPLDDGTLWYGRYGSRGGTMRPGLFKVSHEGELLWMYDDAHEDAMSWYVEALPLEGGGVLFACDVDPREATPPERDEYVYLCWLDETGDLVNVKGYRNETGIGLFQTLHAFADGFVMAGSVESEAGIEFVLLHLDRDGEVLGMAKLPIRTAEQDAYASISFSESKDGKLYAYGIEYVNSHNEEDNTYDFACHEIYYVEIKLEDFINE